MKDNAMRSIGVEKVVLNIGCGTTKKIEDAVNVLAHISGMKPVVTKSRKRSTFNVPKGKQIGCKVTIRKDACKLLERLLEAKERALKASSFDSTGNVSFGVKEHIEIPGVEYNPKIGIVGLDVCVTLERPGYRTKRKRMSSRVGKKHAIAADDAAEFMRNRFNVKIM